MIIIIITPKCIRYFRKVIIKRNIMNEVLKTIYERRAIRKFKDKLVDKKLINQIIDAGKMAPSAINHQPWKFYIVTNKEDIRLFSKEITVAVIKSIPKMGLKNIV